VAAGDAASAATASGRALSLDEAIETALGNL